VSSSVVDGQGRCRSTKNGNSVQEHFRRRRSVQVVEIHDREHIGESGITRRRI
jgi:hypothetical protein